MYILLIPLVIVLIPLIFIIYYIVKSILTDTFIIFESADNDEMSDEDLEILNKINNRKKER